MRLNLTHNWIAKILSLLLAIAIWFLIKQTLEHDDGGYYDTPPNTIVPTTP